jgi:hypothetical protein
MSRLLGLLLLALLLLGQVPGALAGPVSWVEVPASSEGRQWWDEGSLRLNRSGYLTVLSRFQPAAPAAGADASAASGGEAAPAAAGRRAAPGRLYVMELDCDQSLYRDTSINGLPQFAPSWQPTGRDDLTHAVLQQACSAYAARLAPPAAATADGARGVPARPARGAGATAGQGS